MIKTHIWIEITKKLIKISIYIFLKWTLNYIVLNYYSIPIYMTENLFEFISNQHRSSQTKIVFFSKSNKSLFFQIIINQTKRITEDFFFAFYRFYTQKRKEDEGFHSYIVLI